MYYYKMVGCIEARKIVPSVGTVIDNVNQAMEGFGFSEKLIIESTITIYTITTELPIPEQVKREMITTAASHFAKTQFNFKSLDILPLTSEEYHASCR